MNGGPEPVRHVGDAPPVAALLRRPTVWVRHHLMDSLRAAGFDDVLPAHLGVFQYPGPEGQRPGVLAARTRSSKQAMNHLLHQLETAGYLAREAHPLDGRTRVVRLTERGWQAMKVIDSTLRAIENSWLQALGQPAYGHLQRGLARLEEILDDTAIR